MGLVVLAQKPAKSAKDLGNRFITGLQKGNVDEIKKLMPETEMFRLFAPSLSKGAYADVLAAAEEQASILENKSKKIIDDLNGFGIEVAGLQLKSVKESKLAVVAPEYYSLLLLVNYKNTSDTLLLEVFKNKKAWYLVDISYEDSNLENIYRKHSQYSAKQYFDLAVSLSSQDKEDEAIKALDKSDFLNPRNKEVFYQKGLIYKKKNDKVKAAEMFKQAYYIDAEFAPAYFENALLALENDEMHYEAITGFEFCLENNYQELIAGKNLIKIYEKQLANEEKYEYSNEQSIKYIRDKLLNVCNKMLDKGEELSDEEKSKLYFTRGMILSEETKYEEAKKDFEKVVGWEKQNHQALHELAWLENELGNYKKSLEYAQKAYSIEKNNEYLAEIAYAKKQLGDYKGAIEDYNTLFKAGKEFETAKKFQNRGDCYKALKNNKMACADYKKSVEMGGEDADMLAWMKKNCK
jgi:tetratricopeptide (TPR) repeat protein